MDTSLIKTTLHSSNATATIELNRPSKRNAFTQSMIDDLVNTLALLDTNPTIRAVVITGVSNGSFCGILNSSTLVRTHVVAFIVLIKVVN